MSIKEQYKLVPLPGNTAGPVVDYFIPNDRLIAPVRFELRRRAGWVAIEVVNENVPIFTQESHPELYLLTMNAFDEIERGETELWP